MPSFTGGRAQALLELIREQEGVAERIEMTVLKEVKPKEEHQRIQQVPGMGLILGMVVVLESGESTRFPSAGDCASCRRTVRSGRTSNGRGKGEKNRKNGNRYLAWSFAEAAAVAIRLDPKIAASYERRRRRRNVPVAMKALACKLAKAVWHVMRGKVCLFRSRRPPPRVWNSISPPNRRTVELESAALWYRRISRPTILREGCAAKGERVAAQPKSEG